MSKDRNTFAKRRRETEKKRKAEEKRERRRRRKENPDDLTEVGVEVLVEDPLPEP